MNYEYIFFDLDGTLIDSSVGICEGIANVLDSYGIKHGGYTELKGCCIGPPLTESWRRYGLPEDQIKIATETYRKYYAETGLKLFSVYDGVEEMLKRLKDGGKKLFVATSKPTPFAKQALEMAGLIGYFIEVYGADFAERLPKEHILREGIEESGVKNLENAILIGDTRFDIIAANQCSLECAAIKYGFGTVEEFKEYGAKYIFDTPKDVADFLLS